ncbi:MAG: aminoimidazole riboside kinase [Gammaproteobacteria bacterium]|nr:aminoimidazole riboside kinase [Gammaproteobacteria bacterium]
MSNKVWVLGDAVVDLIPQDQHTYLKCPGGAPANVAVAVARLGSTSAFIGRVGNDPLGHFMKRVLEEEQVDTRHMLLDPLHRTSTVLVDLNDEGERSFHFLVNPSADQFLCPHDLPAFSAGEWLHLCSIALINEPARGAAFAAMRQIRAAGGWISFDPNLRLALWPADVDWRAVVLEAMALADLIKLSEEEAMLIGQCDDPGAGVAALRQCINCAHILVTLGERGTDWYHDGICQRIASQPVKPVDTTGAGDAFVGGLLGALAKVPNWQDLGVMARAIALANACGALATTAKGAMTALPTQQQLAGFLTDGAGR